jgi:hypothetical protein
MRNWKLLQQGRYRCFFPCAAGLTLTEPCAGLLQLLELPAQTGRLLAGTSIAMANLPAVVQGAWQLHDSLEALKVQSAYVSTGT